MPSGEAIDNAPAKGNIAKANISNDNGVGAAVGTFTGSPGRNIAITDQGGVMSRLRQADLI